MKKTIWIVAAAILLLSLLAGCRTKPADVPGTDTGTEEPTTAVTDSGEILLERQKETPYVIIVGKNADEQETEAANRLYKAFRQYLQLSLPVRIDLIQESSGFVESPYEILVGDTSRAESEAWGKNMRAGDYRIRKAGTKLVIIGASPESTGKAVDAFVDRFLKSANGTLRITDADAVSVTGDYPVPSFTVDGTELCEMTVAWSGKGRLNELSAELLATALTECYGYAAKALPAYQAGNGRRLRAVTVAELPELAGLLGDNAAVLTAADGNPVLLARDAASLTGAMRTLAAALRTTGSLSLESGRTALRMNPGDTMSVLSFNLYGGADYDNRKNAVLNVIATYLPDTFGIQEGKDAWVNFFASALSEYYAQVGLGNQEDGYTETFNHIYYRKDRFNLIEGGTIWLSDNIHEAGSKLPESKRVRIATYALLEDRESGKRLLHVNTHLDNQSALAREKQLNIVMRLISSFDAPCVLTGDFNSVPGSSVYAMATSVMTDARVNAAERDTAPTYNGLGSSSHILDYCFFSQNRFELLRYRVHDKLYQGNIYPSDHNAILVEYRIR